MSDEPLELPLCPKCQTDRLRPSYVPSGVKWNDWRYQCTDRVASEYHPMDGDCPLAEHMHERCPVCRYERIGEVAK